MNTTKNELLKSIRKYEQMERDAFARAERGDIAALSWIEVYHDNIDNAWRQYHSIQGAK